MVTMGLWGGWGWLGVYLGDDHKGQRVESLVCLSMHREGIL